MKSESVTTMKYEPCARTDGGINILRDGESWWESSWAHPSDLVNGVYSNKERWADALLICDAMNLLDRADAIGWERGFQEGRS